MIMQRGHEVSISPLGAAGLAPDEVEAWAACKPRSASFFPGDSHAFSKYWHLSAMLLDRLPQKSRRNDAEQSAAELIKQCAREARIQFMTAHAEELYDILTDRFSRFVRIDDLVVEASAVVPGLVPTPEEVAAERYLPLCEKDGIEIDQGLFLSSVLASERCGRHLCHAMLLPLRQARELGPQLARDGIIDFGTVSIERQDKASVITMKNPRYLNAEDQTTIDAMAICVDLALLDDTTKVAVLRGGPVEHPKYADRRVFGSGINLTSLYHGRIPYLWYLERDLGYVHKIYRGLARTEALPDDIHGDTIEKPWIAAVEAFAIGGHCQLLLVTDYVIAERNAYLTLPARKEGIIPGMANMRLPRFTGDRIARQAIQYERRLNCDSPEGRLICDEISDVASMDTAIDRAVLGLSSSGLVSVAANRRAIRVAQEPLDLFRSYAAVYAREQAYCHFSPALIANLERYWNAQNRSG